jgi:UDP-glucose 4-epimerase
MVKRPGKLGCQVTTLDNLSIGHRDPVLNGDFVPGSIADADHLHRLLCQGFDAVMHFASFIQVLESMQHRLSSPP